jgi:hypothetical protein
MRVYDPICSIEGCEQRHQSLGFCGSHYWRFKKYGDPLLGATRRPRAPRFCVVENCDRLHVSKGYCRGHLGRIKRNGNVGVLPIRTEPRGSIDKNGYRSISVPAGTPGARSNRGGAWSMLEHRYVMAQILGRPLRADEEVHHKNAERADNRPENLELWSRYKQPPGARAEDLLAWAEEIIALYGHLARSAA